MGLSSWAFRRVLSEAPAVEAVGGGAQRGETGPGLGPHVGGAAQRPLWVATQMPRERLVVVDGRHLRIGFRV